MIRKTIVIISLLCANIVSLDLSAADFVTYDKDEATYIVSKTYVVAPFEALLIPAGHKVVFLPNTGIDVKGELIIDGRADKEVRLTSQEASSNGLGAPGDWAGIVLHPGSKTYISHATIAYAKVGINSCCEDIALVSTVFVANGVNLKIGGNTAKVANRQPINYDATQIDKFIDIPPPVVEEVQPESEPESRKKARRKREPKPKKESKSSSKAKAEIRPSQQ